MQQTQSYIVRQPIHDKNNELYAYEILYVEDNYAETAGGDMAAATAIETLLVEFQQKGLLEGKIAFVNFTPKLLIRNVPQMFDPDKLVIQIDEEALLDPLAMQIVKQYRKKNYKIALKGFEFNNRYISALENVDMIKINFNQVDEPKKSVIEIAKGLEKTVVAYNVNDEKTYHIAKLIGVKYMQGSYIGAVLPQKVPKLNHLQGNFFQLMVAVTKEEADFNEIEGLIARDVTMTYALLKLVNSAYFALRNEVESVHQALVVLGIAQLRQWIYVLSLRPDSKEMPSEFIKTSFLRANFCSELLPLAKDVPISKAEAYLLGMFSTLGALMDIPLEEALSGLNISEHITQALVTHEGRAGILYDLVLDYEKGNWVSMSNHADELGLPVDAIAQKYFDCMAMVDDIWNSFTEINPLAKES